MLKRLVRDAFRFAGLDLRRLPRGQNGTAPVKEVKNQVMPDLGEVNASAGQRRLISARVPVDAALLGTAEELQTYAFLNRPSQVWNWEPDVQLPEATQIIVLSVPQNAEQWHAFHELKRRHGGVRGIQEIVLPITAIRFAQSKLDYYLKSLDDIAPTYLGETFFGPIDRLNELCPLRGKRVIEFGPFDGAQTAGLVRHGVKDLLCVEARAENFIKTLIAREVFGWTNVRLVMNDFHDADANRYGRFDLAFCHGTYYHAMAPFLFLENLVTLSDNVFLGGFVLTDDAAFETLEYRGETYRVQEYEEVTNYTAGVNSVGYYFHPDDLTKFFVARGYWVTVMDDEQGVVDGEGNPLASGRFYRFFAAR